MKKLLFSLYLVLIVSIVASQEYCEWTEPEIITDTNSFYANPIVSVYNSTSWMFYEKQEEVSSIFKMDLNDLSDNVELLSSELINYKQPHFELSNTSGFLGHLFYLSDEEGADNLYVVKLFDDNSLSSPTKIIQNSENHDIMDYSLHWDGIIGYTIDSVIYGANLFISSDTVYTGNESALDSSSFNAQVNFRTVYWQKMELDSSHIFNTRYTYNSDSGFYYWPSPTCIDSIDNSNWLISSRMPVDWGGVMAFCWEKHDTVFVLSDWNNDLFFLRTDLKPNTRQISMINWMIGVKTDFWDYYYLCFTTGLGDDSEIYCNSEYCGPEGEYLSNNNYPDDNPEVFFGEFKSSGGGGSRYYVYCIWQSHIDGHIALSMSKSVADFTSSVDENLEVDNYLKVSPNPFTENLNVSFNAHGQDAEIKIIDAQGRIVANIENINLSNDWQNITWQPPSKISQGIYVVTLKVGNITYSRKIVRQ